MKSTIYVLTIYRSSKRSITNIYNLLTFEDLESAIEHANKEAVVCNKPYKIEESYTEKIYNLDLSSNDDTIDKNTVYLVCSDCDDWDDYYIPYKTLAEAKVHAKECIRIESCHAYVEKNVKKIVMKG